MAKNKQQTIRIKSDTASNLKVMMKWLNKADDSITYQYGSHRAIDPSVLLANIQKVISITENQSRYLIEIAKTAGYLHPVYTSPTSKKAKFYRIANPSEQQTIKTNKRKK